MADYRHFLIQQVVFRAQDLFVRCLGVLLLDQIQAIDARQIRPLFLQNHELLPERVQPRIGNEGLAGVVAAHDLVKLQLALDAHQDAVARWITQVVYVSQRQSQRLRRGLDMALVQKQKARQQGGQDRVFHGHFGE